MPRRLSAHARRLLLAALAAAAIAAAPAAALADAAAGSAAFEKGDYVRAMAEWEGAAERGDADAEFGLGMLYERGDGAVQQNYKTADRWYEKAAAQGNIGAEYRLALIWSAGEDGFPPDLVEAYKWILLASEKGLATDVKAELTAVLDARQLAEGEARAAAWKKAHAAPPPAPPPSAALPAIPPPTGAAPTTAAKAGGCPGWPFPTLPCTEQFPALGGAAPAASRPATRK